MKIKEKVLYTRVSPELHTALLEIADEQDTTVATIIRIAIVNEIARYKLNKINTIK